MQDIRKKLGIRVRELRKSMGWSQEELGEKAGLHPTYIGGIERGERNVSLDNVAKLSSAFKMSVAELFEFSEKEDDAREKVKVILNQLDDVCVVFVLNFVRSLGEFEDELLAKK